MFTTCAKPPIVKDRRTTPSHGYRAAHVIVFPEDIPVEIQIRTTSQDKWAQIAESLGDRWGRGLRYGAGPDEPDSPAEAPFGPSLTRAQAVELWTRMSDQIDLVEQLDLELGNLEKLVDSGDFPQPETLEAFKCRFEEGREGVQSLFAELGYGELAEPTVSEEQT